MTCKILHTQVCHEGWVDGMTETVKHEGKHQKRTTVMPCDSCEPGRFAVWKAGLLKHDWNRNPEAMALYNKAMGVEPDEAPKRRKRTW